MLFISAKVKPRKELIGNVTSSIPALEGVDCHDADGGVETERAEGRKDRGATDSEGDDVGDGRDGDGHAGVFHRLAEAL